jgi:SAM-dependent methyltransferase
LSETDIALHVPVELRRGGLKGNEQKSIESAVALIELMCESFGIPSLEGARLLDMGCGVKFTQAILSRGLPIRQYVGVDVYKDMIDFLQQNVTDPRFQYHHVNTRNAMYNPDGDPLSEGLSLPFEQYSFDFICLFSVFTHLSPVDFLAMLRQLRHYIRPQGKLFFTLFLNELSDAGHGFMDKFVENASRQGIALTSPEEPQDFVDFFKDEPLKVALYSRKLVFEMLEESGWIAESVYEPGQYIAHYMVCTPK